MSYIAIADSRYGTKIGMFNGSPEPLFKSYNCELNCGTVTINWKERPAGMCHAPKEYRSELDMSGGCLVGERFYENEVPIEERVYGKFVHDKRYKKVVYRRASDQGNSGWVKKRMKIFSRSAGYRSRKELGGYEGICETFYVNGRAITQKFTHINGVNAYDIKIGVKCVDVMGPRNRLICVFKSDSPTARPDRLGNPIVNDFDMYKTYYLERRNANGVLLMSGQKVDGKKEGAWVEGKESGRYNAGIRVGKWKIDGIMYKYERGTAIPYELLEKANNMSIKEILAIPNTQVRALVMQKAKITDEVLKTATELIHEATQVMTTTNGKVVKNPIKLYEYPDLNGMMNKYIEVICPTTATKYQLDVPRDATDAIEALQWTYGVDKMAGDKPLKFVEET